MHAGKSCLGWIGGRAENNKDQSNFWSFAEAAGFKDRPAHYESIVFASEV
jgi:hypothetical protein